MANCLKSRIYIRLEPPDWEALWYLGCDPEVIRLGAKLLCLQALIFRELRVLLFQSVPILVPLLDPPALTRSLMCGNVLQS